MNFKKPAKGGFFDSITANKRLIGKTTRKPKIANKRTFSNAVIKVLSLKARKKLATPTYFFSKDTPDQDVKE